VNNPIQCVIDFLCSAVTHLSPATFKDITDKALPRERKLLKAYQTQLILKDDAAFGKYHYVPSSPESLAFASDYASRLWDKFHEVGTIKYLDTTVQPAMVYDLTLPNSKELKLISEDQHPDFITLLDTIQDKKSKLELKILIKMIFKVAVSNNDLQVISNEFVRFDADLDDLITVVSSIKGYFMRYIQPEIRRLYQCSPFAVTGHGHSCLLVERDAEFSKFVSKVNLSKYPLALGNAIDFTESSYYVKLAYMTYSDLDSDSLAIFALRDLKFPVK